MATDISKLLNKQPNSSQQAATETVPANEKVTSDEWNTLVQAVQENQASVKVVKMGTNEYKPVDGVVTLPYTAEGSEVSLKTTDDLKSMVSITGKATLHLLYTSTSAGYDTAQIGTMKLIPKKEDIDLLKDDYEQMKQMIFGEIPNFEEVIYTIQKMEKEINKL